MVAASLQCNRAIFLAGVSCVGKSSIGARLADIIDFRFCDLDEEAERYFQTPIRRLRDSHKSEYSYLRSISQVLQHALTPRTDIVVALPPDGLLVPIWDVIKQLRNQITVLIWDTPENIVDRICFFDIDSKPVKKVMTRLDKKEHIFEVKRDMQYFRHSFRRANIKVDIFNCDLSDAVNKVHDSLKPWIDLGYI